MIAIQTYPSPVGELIIGSYNEQLILCDWKYRKMRKAVDDRIQKTLQLNYTIQSSPIIDECIQQLEEYFTEKRQDFSVPLHFIGTSFQQSVWKALYTIPYGTTETYLELSKKLGNAKAVRAVASANGANAISILVPCHRIVGSNNELTGYAGGLPTKKKLLELEKCPAFSSQLDLF